MRVVLVVVCLALAALAAASVQLFILHEDYLLPRADAVVVLAGSEERLDVGRGLVARGVASTLVVSDGLDPEWWAANRLCRWGDDVVCPRPDPYSTRGEARMIAKLARERGWRSIMLVTSRFHLHRATLLVERCFDGRLGVAGSDTPRWRLPYLIALEWAKLARAELARGC